MRCFSKKRGTELETSGPTVSKGSSSEKDAAKKQLVPDGFELSGCNLHFSLRADNQSTSAAAADYRLSPTQITVNGKNLLQELESD